jgi:hypothetical protein
MFAGALAGARAGLATPLPSKHARLHASSSILCPLQGRPFPTAGLVSLYPCICSYAANKFRQAKAQPFVLLSYVLRRAFSVSSASDPRSFLSISSASGRRRLSFVLTVEFRSIQVEFLHGCFVLDSLQNESFLIIVNN